jgi:hypothetical protein
VDVKRVVIKNQNWPKSPPESDARPDILALILAVLSLVGFVPYISWWLTWKPPSNTWGPTWPWILFAGLAWCGAVSGAFGLRRAEGVAARRMSLAGLIIGVVVGVLSVLIAVLVGTTQPVFYS